MAQNFKHSHNDSSSWVQRFEEMLLNQEQFFFEVEAYEAIIDHYSSQGKWDEALHACEIGIRQHPFSSDLLLDKADLLTRLGQYDEALSLIEQVLMLHPSETDALLLKSNILSILSRFEEAIDTLRTALHWAQDDTDIWFQMAWAYQHWGKPEKAIALYEKVFRKNPAHDLVHYEYLHCLDQRNQIERGITFYKKEIDRNPYNAYAWFYLGDVYAHIERFEDALHALEYATLIDDNFGQALFKMGNTYMNLGQYGQAKECYERLIEKEDEPAAELFCYLGACYEKEGNLSQALHYYREALRIDDACDEAWYGIACCFEASERWFEAIHHYEKACKLDPFNGNYYLNLAKLEFKVGHVVSALEHFQYAAELMPFDTECWLHWSYVYYEQGDYEKAIEVLQEGIDANPEEVDLLYRMVAYLLRDARFQEAIHYLERALLLDFDKHEALYEFFEDLQTQKMIFRMVEMYRPQA
ncbi:tetratricopeptide repeat protein [Thermonema rossianum]|uniref:tetratricopeptide repeat protein n=1 Tax=Thermonema rossianum TaxID=55505 RepID=UPI00056DBD37|nr:tetratricopeptide repeat protein [Thermonema rossianum]